MRILPAEWDKHFATWLAWPQNNDNWPGKMQSVAWAFAEMVRLIAGSELVYIACNTPDSKSQIADILNKSNCNMDNVELVIIPTDYGWFRDCGPQFILNDSKLEIADFKFNAWAKYPEWTDDDKVPHLCAEINNTPIYSPMHNNRQIVFEGGAIDVNGCGTILTTRECMLDDKIQVRNAGFTARVYEQIFAENFGAINTIWLNCGITGDDTHGHVDDLARFVNRRQIVAIREKNNSDVNYRALEENRDILASALLEDGSKPEIIELPMPEPKFYNKHRLPASYANFYITNNVVLVPTFNDPSDYKALGILSELFPEREVCGIHALDLVVGRGSIHCLTRQQPETAQQ